MATRAKQSPSWRFPPRNGGADYVSDPASAHFSDAPIPKLVREVIQNSLDAKDTGFSTPVVVTFEETSLPSSQIGRNSLKRHLQVCRERAETEGRADTISIFDQALESISKRDVRCLAITDTGTTGLDDPRWHALVMQEGAVSKPGGIPSGGSYGTGKNAVLNVSDLQTVFYSTRYVQGRKGRVEKLQGKSTLMAHPDPDGTHGDLQHIGFYTKSDGQPLMGREIPKFFRLDETGAGVFIMGFNPRSENWADETAAAVAQNFFCAIHDRELVVEVLEAKRDVRIDHQTLASIFDKIGSRAPAAYYYQAIRDGNSDTTNPL